MTFDTLISGAGPTGLTGALFLASRGLKVAIVDRNESRSNKSKAMGVHAGTLELLAAAISPGLSEELIAAGLRVRDLNLHTETGGLHADLSSIPSRFNFLLIIPQAETERILENHLGAAGSRVRRGLEASAFTQDAEGVRLQAGNEELRGKFLIGADGAHSITRHQLGIDFHGGTYDGLYNLADLHVQSRVPWKQNEIQVFVSRHGAAAFFPFREKGRYRFMTIPRHQTHIPENASTDLSLEQLRQEAKPFLPADISFSDPAWLTRFRVNHRLADSFGRGRVFLAGDAAHIHSPVGGQGMNTGMHDVINLGSKIEEVLLQGRSPQLLDLYERERRPVAEEVVRWTDFAFRQLLAPESWKTRFLRETLLPMIGGQAFVQKRLARMVSEVDVAHVEIQRLYERG